jgi:hypothetical protein
VGAGFTGLAPDPCERREARATHGRSRVLTGRNQRFRP